MYIKELKEELVAHFDTGILPLNVDSYESHLMVWVMLARKADEQEERIEELERHVRRIQPTGV